MIDDRRVGNIFRVERRFERGPHAGIAAEILITGLGAHDDVLGAVVDRERNQLAAMAALLQQRTRQRRQVQGAQHDDDQHDDRGHAEDLFLFDR